MAEVQTPLDLKPPPSPFQPASPSIYAYPSSTLRTSPFCCLLPKSLSPAVSSQNGSLLRRCHLTLSSCRPRCIFILRGNRGNGFSSMAASYFRGPETWLNQARDACWQPRHIRSDEFSRPLIASPECTLPTGAATYRFSHVGSRGLGVDVYPPVQGTGPGLLFSQRFGSRHPHVPASCTSRLWEDTIGNA
jgi:hypothetical protein